MNNVWTIHKAMAKWKSGPVKYWKKLNKAEQASWELLVLTLVITLGSLAAGLFGAVKPPNQPATIIYYSLWASALVVTVSAMTMMARPGTKCGLKHGGFHLFMETK